MRKSYIFQAFFELMIVIVILEGLKYIYLFWSGFIKKWDFSCFPVVWG